MIVAQSPRQEWLGEYQDSDLSDLRRQRFRDTRFRNCRFQRLTNAVLERCSLESCRFEPDSLLDMLGVTLTLDCFVFDGLEMNELGLDAFLYLLSRTRGNEQKRRVLEELIAPARRAEFDELFERVTRR